MQENAFIGKTQKPTQKELAAELGGSKALWDELVTRLAADCGVTDQEWNSYSPKAGWSLRLKRKKRVIVHMAPCHGSFRVAFVLGEKAMKAAQHLDFPASVVQIMEEARRYPEGFAIRLDIKAPADIENVAKLAQAKIEN